MRKTHCDRLIVHNLRYARFLDLLWLSPVSLWIYPEGCPWGSPLDRSPVRPVQSWSVALFSVCVSDTVCAKRRSHPWSHPRSDSGLTPSATTGATLSNRRLIELPPSVRAPQPTERPSSSLTVRLFGGTDRGFEWPRSRSSGGSHPPNPSSLMAKSQ